MDDQNQAPDADVPADGDPVGTSVITGFPQYFESANKSQWSWIAVAVMIGNYSKTGPLENGTPKKWKQADVITSCTGTNSNVSGSPDSSMNVTLVYSPQNTANADLAQSLPAIRNAIDSKAPVVVGYGTLQGDQLANARYFVVYGYNGAYNWYFADPSKDAITQDAPLPIPDGDNVVTKVVYSRIPKLNMK